MSDLPAKSSADRVSAASARQRSAESIEIKPSAAWFLSGFHRFLRPYLKRHFQSIAVESDSLCLSQIDPDAPLLIYANHPSWWDPLIAQFLNRSLFPERHFFAPIDAAALEQYKVFERLGFYGVELTSTSGAASFLKKSQSIMRRSDSAIWITPEGRFADSRDHAADLMPGLAHLCKRSENATALPLALEYVFWEERLPLCLVTLGKPRHTADHRDWSKSDWSKQLTHDLREAQRRLAELSIGRDSTPFENLLRGTRGTGWFYDSFRRVRCWITGKPFRPSHGEHFT